MPTSSEKLSRPPLERMMRIHDELRRGTLTNCTRLVKLLEVSRKTIVRDLAFMRDRLDLPIEYDAPIRAYRYTYPVTAFPTVQVTEGELLALLVARRALEQYQGTPFHRQLELAFEKLTSGLKDKISFSPADELRAVSFKNIGLGKTDLVAFNALSSAVLRQLEVDFLYRKSGAAQAELRRVQPYHLSHRENLWYLIALDLERRAMRTFALPRLSEVKVTKIPFVRPADFSPERFFANALGVMSGNENYLVRIRFARLIADRVRERVWHDSQVIEPRADGSIDVTLRLGALAEVEKWILGWGPQAEVLAPEILRDHIAKSVAEMSALYSARRSAGK